MKVIRRGIKSFLEAKALADKLALETDRIYSVRAHKTATPPQFAVVEGYGPSPEYSGRHYVARPQTLKFKKGLPPLFGLPWERSE
jgi:hypothetical protein